VSVLMGQSRKESTETLAVWTCLALNIGSKFNENVNKKFVYLFIGRFRRPQL
jgi:hypothetical protein